LYQAVKRNCAPGRSCGKTFRGLPGTHGTKGFPRHYGKTAALQDVNLSVRPGDIYGFLGRNGAGKSTTIKILAGLVRADQGSVKVLDSKLSPSHPKVRSRMGFLIENPAFFPHLNAWENLLCHGFLQGGSKKEKQKEIQACIEQVELKDAAHRRVGGYSTGMKQRLGLAQAFLGNPEIIVLDEPLNGLDPEGIYQIRELLRQRAESRGTTFFVSSHILAEVEQLCNRVGFIAQGKTVAEGTLEELGATGWISVKVSQPEEALQKINAKWPAASPRLFRDKEMNLRMDEALIPDLVRFLVDERFDLYSVTLRPRSLEEIFMEQTRGDS